MDTKDENKTLSFDQGHVLTADEIAAADDIEYKRIPAFKKGEFFCIRSLTANDMIVWSEAGEGEAKKTAGLRLIVKSLVDGEPGVDKGALGKLILNDEHIAMLRKKTHKITENIVKEILRHNGMTVKGDKTEAQDSAKKD